MIRLAACLVALLIAAPTSFADEDPADAPEAPEAEASSISGETSVEVVARYLYRGFVLEDEGFIAHADASVHVEVLAGEGFVRSLSLWAEWWNAFHGGETGLDGENGAPAAWAETDVYAGLAADLAGGVSVAAWYARFESPNGAYGRSAEAIVAVAWDDTERWGREGAGFVALLPSLTVGVETRGQSDGGDREGAYLGLAISPTFRLGDDAATAVSLAFPVTLGASLFQYYEDADGEDHLFGYLEVGVEATIPLDGAPGREGRWSLVLGGSATFLGEGAQDANGEDGPVWNARAALRLSF